MPKHTTANGRKTNAPQAFCKLGNAIPIMKLHDQEDKLPKAIAAGRGALSNNSENSNVS